jgi:hypothetical protein
MECTRATGSVALCRPEPSTVFGAVDMKPESIRIRARQGSEERGQLRVVNLFQV